MAADPNDPRALARRARTLRSAWRPPVADRADFLVERCRGARVLDIGCVAHDIARMRSPEWLHGRIAAVASSCLGVDVLASGVAEMTRLGYDVVVHDLATGPGPIAERGPFDVVVAGELIEHVESLDMLFRTAADLMAPDGQLILTTPNPWSPSRVRAGQRGDVWENVDHILFAFPSGVAELAERHGLVLAEAATTTPRSGVSAGLAARLRATRRRLRGTQWASVGFSTQGPSGVVRIRRPASGVLPRLRSRNGFRFLGGTFVYVIRRPVGAAG